MHDVIVVNSTATEGCERKRMVRWSKWLMAAMLAASTTGWRRQIEAGAESRRRPAAYEASVTRWRFSFARSGREDPRDGMCSCCWQKASWNCRSMTRQSKAREAVSIDPRSSVYHEWAGKGLW